MPPLEISALGDLIRFDLSGEHLHGGVHIHTFLYGQPNRAKDHLALSCLVLYRSARVVLCLGNDFRRCKAIPNRLRHRSLLQGEG